MFTTTHSAMQKTPKNLFDRVFFGVLLTATTVLASPTCFDIVGSCSYGFVPGSSGWVPGEVCYASCDGCFEVMIPGTQCQLVVSVGGPITVACLEGVIFQNPDGTFGCNTSGGYYYYGTFDKDLQCLSSCLGGGPR